MSGRRAHDSRLPHPFHRPQWFREGWSTGRWGFVATLAVVTVFSALTLAAGIIVVVSHPPPIWTFVSLGVFALWQLARRRAMSGPAPDANIEDPESPADPEAGNPTDPPRE